MAFTVKDWRDSPTATTPLSAAALEDLETRVTNYADTVGGADPVVLSTEGMGVIVHGATAGTARGTAFAQYTWIGTVEPTNMDVYDLWVDIT